jgi:CBS domain containing-hemolysin-like protein
MDTFLDSSWRIAAVLLLVAVNGFFVAAEFALVSARRTRIDALAAEGSARARLVQRAMDDPNRFISAAQVGITVASLLLGAIGEPALEHILEPAFLAFLPGEGAVVSAHGVAFVLSLALITFMHIVLGEQVPKMFALQRAEGTILFTALFTQRLALLFRPVIAALYWGTELVLKPLGLKYQGEHSLVYTEEELKMLVTASTAGGVLEESEEQIINRVFSFTDTTAAQVMVPRTEMSAVPVDISLSELTELAVGDGHTRFPVYEGTLDDIVGVVNTKDLVRVLAERSCNNNGHVEDFDVRQIVRDVLVVPETQSVSDVMAEMKRRRNHLAIVIDEYGGTSGLVTLEDLLERIVGDVQDEFQEAEEPDVQRLPDGAALVNGLLGIDEFNEEFDTDLEEPDYNTIGGAVFGRLGRKPEIGDEVDFGFAAARVEALDGLRIAKLRITPAAAAPAAQAYSGDQRESA